MDKCQIVQDMLADYRTGVLAAKKLKMVEAHLAECSACAEELRLLDDVLTMVTENAPEAEPPVGLWNGVANRIADQSPSRRPVARSLKPLRLLGTSIAAAALVMALWLSWPQQATLAPTFAPTARAKGNEYVQGHALYAGQAPLADRVSYLAVAVANDTGTK